MAKEILVEKKISLSGLRTMDKETLLNPFLGWFKGGSDYVGSLIKEFPYLREFFKAQNISKDNILAELVKVKVVRGDFLPPMGTWVKMDPNVWKFGADPELRTKICPNCSNHHKDLLEKRGAFVLSSNPNHILYSLTECGVNIWVPSSEILDSYIKDLSLKRCKFGLRKIQMRTSYSIGRIETLPIEYLKKKLQFEPAFLNEIGEKMDLKDFLFFPEDLVLSEKEIENYNKNPRVMMFVHRQTAYSREAVWEPTLFAFPMFWEQRYAINNLVKEILQEERIENPYPKHIDNFCEMSSQIREGFSNLNSATMQKKNKIEEFRKRQLRKTASPSEMAFRTTFEADGSISSISKID